MGTAGHKKKESGDALSNNEYANTQEIVTTGEEQLSPNHYKSPSSQGRIGANINIEGLPTTAAFKT